MERRIDDVTVDALRMGELAADLIGRDAGVAQHLDEFHHGFDRAAPYLGNAGPQLVQIDALDLDAPEAADEVLRARVRLAAAAVGPLQAVLIIEGRP